MNNVGLAHKFPDFFANLSEIVGFLMLCSYVVTVHKIVSPHHTEIYNSAADHQVLSPFVQRIRTIIELNCQALVQVCILPVLGSSKWLCYLHLLSTDDPTSSAKDGGKVSLSVDIGCTREWPTLYLHK